MSGIASYICCGETRITPFCPICGKRRGIVNPLPEPSVMMTFHFDPVMVKELVNTTGLNFRLSFAAACDKCLSVVVERLLHAGYTRANNNNHAHSQVAHDTYTKITEASVLLGMTRAELARCCLKVYINEELRREI